MKRTVAGLLIVTLLTPAVAMAAKSTKGPSKADKSAGKVYSLEDRLEQLKSKRKRDRLDAIDAFAKLDGNTVRKNTLFIMDKVLPALDKAANSDRSPKVRDAARMAYNIVSNHTWALPPWLDNGAGIGRKSVIPPKYHTPKIAVTPAAAEVLRQLADADARVRLAGIDAARKLNDADIPAALIDALKALADKEDDVKVKELALQVAKAIEDRTGLRVDALTAQLKSADAGERLNAVIELRQYGRYAAKAVAILEQMKKGDAVEGVRVEAARSTDALKARWINLPKSAAIKPKPPIK